VEFASYTSNTSIEVCVSVLLEKKRGEERRREERRGERPPLELSLGTVFGRVIPPKPVIPPVSRVRGGASHPDAPRGEGAPFDPPEHFDRGVWG
jgi:hypothetical protein